MVLSLDNHSVVKMVVFVFLLFILEKLL